MEQELFAPPTASQLHTKRKKEIKRILVSAIAFVVITIVLFSAQTIAYFTSNITSSQNGIVSGIIDITLTESALVNGSTTSYTTESVSIMPATTVSKIPTVTNSGSLNVRVRMKVELILSTKNKVTDAELAALDAALDTLVTYNVNVEEYADKWTYEDGYYYYKDTLTPGQTTVPLFDTVLFSPAMGNEYTNSTIKFIVTAEASQVTADGSALAWPSNTTSSTPADTSADSAEG